MRKLLNVLICLSVLSAAVFATGNPDAAANGNTIQLTLWHRWSGGHSDRLNEVVKAFEEKNPDIKITVVAKPGEYMPLLQSLVANLAAGNQPPDMFVGGYNLLNYITTELQPVELKDLAPSTAALAEVESRFNKSIYNTTNVNGKHVGMPFALSNIVMFVNMDIFKAAGLTEADIPTTWDEVMRVGKIIKSKTKKYPIAIQMPDTWPDFNLIYSAGGTIKTRDDKKVNFTNAGAIEALTMWQNLYKEGLVPIETDAEFESDFAAGNIAMRPTSCMKGAGYAAQANFDLRCVKFPSFTGKSNKLAAGGAAIISFTKDKTKRNAVWKFLDFAVSKESMNIFTKTGYLSVTNADVKKTPLQAAAYEQASNMIMWPNWPGGATGMEIERLYYNTRNTIILEGAPVAPSLKKLEEDCNKLL